jgi:hypothetical protein
MRRRMHTINHPKFYLVQLFVWTLITYAGHHHAVKKNKSDICSLVMDRYEKYFSRLHYTDGNYSTGCCVVYISVSFKVAINT